MIRALTLSSLVLLATPIRADEKDPSIDGKPLSEWITELKANIQKAKRTEALANLKAIVKAGPKNREAVLALVHAAAHHRDAKYISDPALEKLTEYGEPIVPLLIEAIKGNDTTLRYGAVAAAGALGPKAKDAIPALAEVHRANTRAYDLRGAYVDAMKKIGLDAVPALIEGLKADNATVRMDSAQAIGVIGPGAKAAVPTLLKALETEKERNTRMTQMGALGRIGPDAADAVPVLVKLLASREDNLNAARALSGIGEPAVPALVKALKDRNFTVVFATFNALRGMGPRGKEAVPALVEMVKDEKSMWRGQAAEVLGWVGEGSDEVVAALRGLLKTQFPYEQAIAALGRLGEKAKDAVPDLVELAKSKAGAGAATRRSSAITALGSIGAPAVPTAVKLLESKDEAERALGVSIVEAMGPKGKSAAAQVIACLKDAPEARRHQIVQLLVRMGPEALPAIVSGLKDEDVGVRKAMPGVLVTMRQTLFKPTDEQLKAFKGASPALVAALKDEQPIVRAEAAKALRWLSTDPAKEVPALLEACKDEDRLTARDAADAAWFIGRSTAVVDGLKHRDPLVRSAMAGTIERHYRQDRRLGVEEIRSLIDVLLAVLKDEDAEVRARAAAALGQVAQLPEKVVPSLAVLFEDRDESVRITAVRALLGFPRTVTDGGPALLKLAKEGKGEARGMAVQALAYFGTDAEKVVPLALEAIKEKDAKARLAVVAGISIMGAKAKDAAPALAEVMKEKDRELRLAAVRAAGNFGADAKPIVPALAELLKEDDVQLVQAVLYTLQRVGPAAKEAVPALLELLKGPQARNLGILARQTLGRIDPEALKNLKP